MKKLVLLFTVSVAVFVAGCVVTSVYPYYTSKDLVFDPSLLGQWIPVDEKKQQESPWEFSKADENEYTVTGFEEGKTNSVSVHLFKLGGKLFMDWFPAAECDDGIPPHYLFKVEQTKPTLRLKAIDYDWLEDLLKRRPSALRHTVVQQKSNGRSSELIVLTADTKELQKFVLKHLNDPKAFNDEVVELKRKNEK
jgi:hypothetical protein